MKSIRLTKEMRENIVSRVLKDAYDEKKEAIQQERYDFSEKVYADIYKKDLEAMTVLPDGWLPVSDEFMVQFGSDSTGYCRRMLQKKKRFLAKHLESYRQCLKIYDDEHEFTKIHDDLTKRIEDIDDEYKKTRIEIYGIVNSCNSTKQLKDAWPEIAKYVEIFEPTEQRTTEIAPVLDDINKRLGLKN